MYAAEKAGKWTTVNYSKFIMLDPKCKSRLRGGILNVLASNKSVLRMTLGGLLNGFKVFCKPKIVQNTTASTTFTATENPDEALSVEGLKSWSSCVPFIVKVESPDGCSANDRKRLRLWQGRR